MALAVTINDHYTAVREADGLWRLIHANTGEPAIDAAYERLADVAEAAGELS